MPPGAPSALASASFAANRAASDSADRAPPESVTRSFGVNSRSARVGVRGEGTGEPLHRNHVDPDADDHAVGDVVAPGGA